MSDNPHSLGENWADVYDGSGTGWSKVNVGAENAVWFSTNQPADEITITCKDCGHAVTVRKGDAPIPHGDSRLCVHFGSREVER